MQKDYIHKVFSDAYKSPLSILVIDDIESIIEFNPVGPRFSNTILQTLNTLLKAPPPKVSYAVLSIAHFLVPNQRLRYLYRATASSRSRRPRGGVSSTPWT